MISNISVSIDKEDYFNLIDNIHHNYMNLNFNIENARLFAFLYSSFEIELFLQNFKILAVKLMTKIADIIEKVF